MTRATWNDIAISLARLRSRLLEHDQHDHADGVLLSARAVCRVLKSRSTRFDSRRFLRIVGTQTK